MTQVGIPTHLSPIDLAKCCRAAVPALEAYSPGRDDLQSQGHEGSADRLWLQTLESRLSWRRWNAARGRPGRQCAHHRGGSPRH